MVDSPRVPPQDPAPRSVVRDLEAYLADLRASFGDDVVGDPAGTVRFATPAAPAVTRSAPAPAPHAEPPRRAAAPPRDEREPPRTSALPAPVPAARAVVPAAGSAGPPPAAGPVQTTLLAGDAPLPPASPGLRRARALEPGVVDYSALPDIVRGPCKPEVRAETLRLLDEQVRVCTKCKLHEARHLTVFGVGNPCARVCFVGEGPGAEEDRRGEPFVGRAGQLLDRIVAAMKLQRSDVYICNTVKCRPPENRTPYPEEMAACAPYLRGQLEALAPQVLVALGRPAAQALLAVNSSLGQLRGRFHRHRGIPVMVTYHPAYLLRNPAAKKDTWEDVQHVMRFLAETPDPLLLPGEGAR
jgi:uracil-DNA glycosylase family 4